MRDVSSLMISLHQLEEELAQLRTQLRSAHQRLAAQQSVTRILAEAVTFSKATPHLIEAICVSTGWEIGAIWNVDPSAESMRCVDLWHSPALPAGRLEAAVRKI